jgi:PAS domain S-box-containing protein
MTADTCAASRKPSPPVYDGRIVVGARGLIEDVDAAGCTLLGYARSELVGLHGSELVPRDAQAATAATLDGMRRGDFARREGLLKHRDGTVIAVEVTAQALPNGRLILGLRRRDVA